MRRSLIVLATLFVVSLAAAEKAGTERFGKVVNEMVEAVNKGDYAGAGRDYAASMEEFFPLEKRSPFFKNLSTQYGKIEKLDKPRLTPPDQAIFVAHCERGKLDIQVWLDDKDKIIGLLFLPHKPAIPVPEKNETRLSLPFKGRWLVFWGGDTKELNQHHDVPNQRFAFDFLGANEEGKTRKGESRVNEDYFAFGREILAPAEGKVTDVINGVRDNVPASMNPYSGLGNAVFIQHREYEVSVLAHLKLGSIKVKVGDKVKRGQVVGLCGNSGNSSEAHLHYHLQNTPIIQDGTGIKCYFDKVIVTDKGDRKSKKNYSPVKGEVVASE
ncbi:MAG TPA: peptidoglycan DD-metalloendopeptidase family protein [Sedimentisphaerales bacterium]|nr:peptidoglycan DD-metalloendopeptidase family protein [Sedimentisphaerales bacterium]